MNPFEENDEPENVDEEINIELWLEQFGRKKNTYISGWKFSDDEFKNIKKKNGCNGSMKIDSTSGKHITQFQGDLISYLYNLLIDQGMSKANITIKN